MCYDMNKNKLRTGMIVTTRDGEEYMVYLNSMSMYFCGDILLNSDKKSWKKLEYYQDDLKHNKYRENDIVKIEYPLHPNSFMDLDYAKEYRKVLYDVSEKEKKKVELTIEEIAEKFGVDIGSVRIKD